MLRHEFVCSNLVAFFQHFLKGYNLVQHAIATDFLNHFRKKNAAKNCVMLNAKHVKCIR